MITAKEAKELYNEVLLVRDKYIEEVLEPLIKENAPTSKSVSVKAIGRYRSNASIDFSRSYADNRVNVALTEAVIGMLLENGYKTYFNCERGTEMGGDGTGELIISWE